MFKSVVRIAGQVTYALELDQIADDKFKENNRYATTIDVPGRPSVLYVEGTPQHAGPLSSALTAQQLDVDVRPPAGFPGSLKEMERYDFLIVSDTPKEALSLQGREIIESYVRDLGGGSSSPAASRGTASAAGTAPPSSGSCRSGWTTSERRTCRASRWRSSWIARDR